MGWIKRGLVFAPDGAAWWARKNASFPTADVLGERLRVYFTSLDENNVGRTGYVDLDARDSTRVLAKSAEPILDVGEPGTFDDAGANVFSVVRNESETRLYYQGWQHTRAIPYLIFTGLAVGQGDQFRKHSRRPVLDRVEDDLFLRGAPFVLRDARGFRMWYVSCRKWTRDSHGLHYDVGIRHATSSDGVDWQADSEFCLAPSSADEYAVGRPCVLYERGIYRMWFSIRSFSTPYRLGYAESPDGRRWTRMDSEVKFERSEHGWDSEMICYPNVVRVSGKLLLFYNGNNHGATGFGVAEET